MSIDRERLLEDLQSILGTGGILENRLDGFSSRPGQVAMAQTVAHSILDRTPLVAEGGTGIGKTLAYLVPSILTGLKVVVATGTKTLQEQIFFKDLPLLIDSVDLPVRATYMKGRSNYLCKLRFGQFTAQGLFRFASEGPLFDEVVRWADVTETGDRAELTDLPDDFRTWSEITSTSDNCLGSHCRFYNSCFVTKMRKKAQDANLIIVNHHLYFADLAVRERRFGEVIPDHDVVIFDEAHLLESVATQYFGVSVSNYRVFSLTDDISRWLQAKQLSILALSKALEECKSAAVRLFEAFSAMQPRFRFEARMIDNLMQEDHIILAQALSAVQRLCIEIGEQRDDDEARGLGDRAKAIITDLHEMFEERREDMVYWGEVRPRSVILHGSPLDVAPLMRSYLFKRPVHPIFTSATLAADGNFDYFKGRLGLPSDAVESLFPSPFNYRRQAALFIPRVMPEPSHQQFVPRAAELINQLIRLSKGRALVLFTSYANMNAVHERLVSRIEQPLLKQGDAPRNRLLDEFRSNIDSVLFATGTFWQGVDVLGEALRVVIIDKLPFESPGDPVTEARIDYLRKQDRNPFYTYQVPTAIIQLKQGVGRLIRDHGDWGIIAILDRRLRSKSYGKFFLRSLPRSIQMDRLEQVSAWWRQKEDLVLENEDKAEYTKRRS